MKQGRFHAFTIFAIIIDYEKTRKKFMAHYTDDNQRDHAGWSFNSMAKIPMA